MHRTTKLITRWSLVIVVLVATGCTPPEPQAPAPAAAPQSAPEAAPAELPAAEAAPPPEAEPAQPQAAAVPENGATEGPQLVSLSNEPREPIARTDESEPQGRTAFYRADAGPAEIPPVALSKNHQALCHVKVGDTMPKIVLPRIGNGSDRSKLAELFGEKATVVVFWRADRRMAREQLADMRPDVIDPFSDQGVAVVGIAVEESLQSAASALQQAGATFRNLLDHDGEAYAKVGSDKLPRTYLLDADGRILWFDIEYSHATRRELHQALRAVVGPQ